MLAIYQSEGRTVLFEEMCPYFGALWPAGKILAQYFSERKLPDEKRILEIGCGLALPSLYLAKCGLQVEATDMHPDVPLFLNINRKLNDLLEPKFISLDWRQPQTKKWDLILASDVLYDQTQPSTVLNFIFSALAPGGRCLLADPGRSYVQGFFDDARKNGFRVKTEGLFGVLIGEISRDVVS